MNQDVVIRWMESEEVFKVSDLIWECFSKKIPNEEFIKNNYHNEDNNSHLIAVKEDEIIGHIWVDRVTDILQCRKYFFIRNVCVKEEYRNEGIGTMLMNKLEEISKVENIEYITFSSANYRTKAHEFYKLLGYEPIQTTMFKKIIKSKK